jgi:hypothetical protein
MMYLMNSKQKIDAHFHPSLVWVPYWIEKEEAMSPRGIFANYACSTKIWLPVFSKLFLGLPSQCAKNPFTSENFAYIVSLPGELNSRRKDRSIQYPWYITSFQHGSLTVVLPSNKKNSLELVNLLFSNPYTPTHLHSKSWQLITRD